MKEFGSPCPPNLIFMVFLFAFCRAFSNSLAVGVTSVNFPVCSLVLSLVPWECVTSGHSRRVQMLAAEKREVLQGTSLEGCDARDSSCYIC